MNDRLKKNVSLFVFLVVLVGGVLAGYYYYPRRAAGPLWEPDFRRFLNSRLKEVYFPAEVKSLQIEEGDSGFSFQAGLRLTEDLYQALPPDPDFQQRCERAMRIYHRLRPHFRALLAPLQLPETEIYRKVALAGEEVVIHGKGTVQRASHDRWLFAITDVWQTELLDGRTLPKAKPWVLDGTVDAARLRVEKAEALRKFEQRVRELEFEDAIQRRMELKH